jgi:hypothetical protein
VCLDEKFKGLNYLVDLFVKLVEINRHIVHDVVYSFLKLVLLLPVLTGSFEWSFSEINLVKHKLRNQMGDSLLHYCLVTLIE